MVRTLPKRYRKTQVDPSVLLSAFNSCLSTTPAALEPSECLVVMTGGTPEPVVAGIAAGYRQIMVICDSSEQEKMMQLPTADEEHLVGNVCLLGKL